MDSIIFEEIRSHSDLVEVVSEYVSLTKRGSNYYGLCPFHTEKTPSFAVNPARQFFHCFGCGEGGNAFNFLMKMERISFIEAARVLAKRCGVVLKEYPGMQQAALERDRMYGLLSDARDRYHELLCSSPAGKSAREYLEGREISPETVEKFHLGFASNEWDYLYRYFHGKGVPDDLLVRSGLVLKRKKGTGCFDRFAGRLIFPIHDTQGRVVAFGGRIIRKESEKQAKYINSPETPLFHKNRVMFGLREARRAMEKVKEVIIVEGYMDCIRAHQHGVENVVATLGTSLTQAHVRNLRGWVDRAVIVFDSDEAGGKGAERTLPFFQDSGIAAEVAVLEKGEDPDDFIRKAGSEAFLEKVEEAGPLMEFIISRAVERNDSTTVEGQMRFVRQVIPSLEKLSNQVERGFYLKRVAEKSGIEEKRLLAEFDRVSSSGRVAVKPEREDGTPESPLRFQELAERYLMALALTDNGICRKVYACLRVDHFLEPLFRSLFLCLGDLVADGHEPDLQSVLMSVKEEGAADFLSRLAFEVPPVDDLFQAADECICVLEERLKKAERQKISLQNPKEEIDKEFLRRYDDLQMKRHVSSQIS